MVKSRSILVSLLVSLFVFFAGCGGGGGGSSQSTSNSTTALLGPNVYVFSPHSKDVQDTISRIYSKQMSKDNEFDESRYAILFKPGAYDLDVRVGYYTQVAGLGLSPDDVTITGAVRTQDNPKTEPIYAGPGALDNFWRSAENLSIIPTLGSLTIGPPSDDLTKPGGISLNQDVWAVSQAAPLRRIHVKPSPITLTSNECTNANAFSPPRKQTDPLISKCPTTLRLFDVGWSSGGYMADSKIDGLVESGSQQQWFSRNCNWIQWNSENWNMVFLGSIPVPAGTWPGTPTSDGAITDAGNTPIVREKPFLVADSQGKFSVVVPELKQNSSGVDWDGATPSQNILSIDEFFVLKSKQQGKHITIDASVINAALAQGKHLLITPGVYFVNGTIAVSRANTVILGLGSASLVANDGHPIIDVADVDGVTIAGLTLDAGLTNSTTLLQVGESTNSNSHSSDPTFLFDLFCRVGGPQYSGKASSCVTINSNDVIGDNLWLWRADHGNVGWEANTADNGLIVNGDRVSMYGLAVEHFQKFQTVWNRNPGKNLLFYQSEMPYDVPDQQEWVNGANPAHPEGYASYKVDDSVTDHQAFGLGVYCYFQSADIIAYHGTEVPRALEPGFEHLVTIWLNGQVGSQITHIINDSGATVTEASRRANLPP